MGPMQSSPVGRRKTIALCVTLLGAAVLAGCGMGSGREASQPGGSASAGQQSAAASELPARAERDQTCREALRSLRSDRLAYAAVLRRPADVFAAPGGTVAHRLSTTNVNGVAMVLGVLGTARCPERWYRVQVPAWPNGSTGWIRARDVRLEPVRTRVLVELGKRRMTLYRDGRVLLRAPAAIGAPSTPTPAGAFYVNQRLLAPNPGGPFGPGAVGISAFSPVLRHWVQGGPIAIHGTNRPDLIGAAASHGCIRIRNDLLQRVLRLAVPGTPVVIRA